VRGGAGMASNWYVIRTEPRAEYLAASELEREGFEVYFPRVSVAFPRVGHTDTPLFPGYLFLKCDPDENEWPVFRPIHRVASWVRSGNDIPALPGDFVESMIARLDELSGGEGLWRRFKPGEAVWVESGSIQGLGKVIEGAKSPKARAKVLLEFMGRIVQAQVPWESLSPVADKPTPTIRLPRRTRGNRRWIRGANAPEGAPA